MAASDYVPIFFKNRLHLERRPVNGLKSPDVATEPRRPPHGRNAGAIRADTVYVSHDRSAHGAQPRKSHRRGRD